MDKNVIEYMQEKQHLEELTVKYLIEECGCDARYLDSKGNNFFYYSPSNSLRGVIIERGGVQLLAGDEYGWGYEMTPAELKKKDEFYAIYYSAVKNAQKEIKELRDLPDYLEDKPIFDSLA